MSRESLLAAILFFIGIVLLVSGYVGYQIGYEHGDGFAREKHYQRGYITGRNDAASDKR